MPVRSQTSGAASLPLRSGVASAGLRRRKRSISTLRPQRRQRAGSGTDADFAQDDLVAAARRAAQAAALRAEERTGGGRARRSSVTIAPGSIPDPDASSKRKRSLLMISAAVLLVISAALLYGRLRSKPEVETTPPAAEESVPSPAGDDQITPLPEGSRHGTAVPGDSQSAPVPVEPSPNAAPSTKSGALEVEPGDVEQEPADGAATGFNQGIDPSPDDSAPSDTSQAGGVTDVAKSSYRRAPAQPDDMPRAQPASFTPEGAVALPPGVSVSIEEPTLGASTQGATPAMLSMPTKLPLPPEALGPISLRQARRFRRSSCAIRGRPSLCARRRRRIPRPDRGRALAGAGGERGTCPCPIPPRGHVRARPGRQQGSRQSALLVRGRGGEGQHQGDAQSRGQRERGTGRQGRLWARGKMVWRSRRLWPRRQPIQSRHSRRAWTRHDEEPRRGLSVVCACRHQWR